MDNSATIWDDLAIISLNYNSAKEVFRQVSSLREEGILDVCFYLIDNASNDGKEIEEYCLKNEVKFIANPTNGGYAQGNNIGIRKAIEDGRATFLILNPDIEISKDTIEKLYNTLHSKPELQIIGPRICDKFKRNLIYSDGGILTPNRLWDHHINYNQVEKGNLESLNTNIDYVTGSVMMFKKSTLDIIGWMREDFFMYYEEAEWCYRLKKHKDLKLGVLTSCKAYHQMSHKGDFYQYYISRNRILFFRMYHFDYHVMIKKTLTQSFKGIFCKKYNNSPSFSKRLNFFILMHKAVYNGLTTKIKFSS